MTNVYSQAPIIKYNGEKMKDTKGWGKAIRTHQLESAIMNGLGERDMAMLKIMLFLTGNAEGFGVAEKTICERCKISESGYKNARKKLIDMGWLTAEKGQLIVNYNNILKIEGFSENTSSGFSENTPLGISENTYNNISDNINNNRISLSVDAPKGKVEAVCQVMKASTENGKFKF